MNSMENEKKEDDMEAEISMEIEMISKLNNFQVVHLTNGPTIYLQAICSKKKAKANFSRHELFIVASRLIFI